MYLFILTIIILIGLSLVKQFKSSKIPIFVISLKNNNKRRKHIVQEFQKNKMPNWQFFNAIRPTRYPNTLSRGQYGCLLSHKKLWKYSLTVDKPILIFEDDVINGEGHKLQTQRPHIYVIAIIVTICDNVFLSICV